MLTLGSYGATTITLLKTAAEFSVCRHGKHIPGAEGLCAEIFDSAGLHLDHQGRTAEGHLHPGNTHLLNNQIDKTTFFQERQKVPAHGLINYTDNKAFTGFS